MRFVSGSVGRCLSVAALAAGCMPAMARSAVIADNGSQTGNPAANMVRPASDPGWDNIGWRGFGTDSAAGASAVYLGNRYVLTAAHVGAGPVTFFTDVASGGTTFGMDSSFSPIRLQTPGNGDADLLIYRLASDPGIAPLNIASSSPAVGTTVRMIGTGLGRGSVTQTSATVVPTGGYLWGTTRAKAWGDDTVSTASSVQQDAAGGQTALFRTQFDANVGATMATDKDSGSGVFAFNSTLNRWELAGITEGIFTFDDQTASSAAFGDQTGFVDLSQYESQFPADVPEPSSAAVLASAIGILLARRSRRTR